MGAEHSVLKGCVLGAPLNVSPPDWAIHPARRADGSKVTVFINKNHEEKEEEHLQNAARQLKILRHPTILKFFASCKNVEATYLITEQVEPLELVLESLSSEEICAGLFNIAEALSFLHDRGGVSHNNVCIASIYVSSQDGGWRLGGMEHLCKFEDATVKFLNQSKKQRCTKVIPPEEKEEDVKTSIAPSIGHARDAYAFGILAQDMLEIIGDLGEMTEFFKRSIEYNFLNDDPKQRPRLVTLLGDKIFRNDFLDISRFLYNLTLKTEPEKNIFFEGLASRLFNLQESLIASRLAPLLLTSFVIAEPVAVHLFFPHFLSPRSDLSPKSSEMTPEVVNPLLSETLFKEHIIPIITRIFSSREMHVRHLLLEYFSFYVNLFGEKTLRRFILPELLLGLKDKNNDLVSSSLRALAELVPLLGADVVVGGERIKYFVEGRPKFPFKSRESTLPKSGSVKQLTAVSGVITLPRLDTNSDPPLPPSSSTLSSPVGGGGRDADTEEDRRLEQDRRREEMRMKNEQRKREREERRQKGQEPKKGPLRLGSADKNLSMESKPLLGRSDGPDDSDISSNSELLDSSDSRILSKHSESVENLNDLNEADWSNWDKNEEPDVFEPIEMPNKNSILTTQHLQSKVEGKGSIDSWRDDWGNEGSDWTDLQPQVDDQTIVSPKSSRLPKSTRGIKIKESGQTKLVKSQTNQGFQGLFEIPEIRLKSSMSCELDFFADMAPSLSFSSSNSNPSASISSMSRGASSGSMSVVKAPVVNMKTSSSVGTLSFAVKENEEVAAAAWGDEDFEFEDL